MPLDLVSFESKAKEAIKAFWGSREAARQRQIEAGRVDQGERAGVTAGKNLDGFISLIRDLVQSNGLPDARICLDAGLVTLPGFFRPTKRWDLLVLHREKLVAAIELKSQVGPSFGNNFNNRAEEAIGTAHDFWTAYRENAFGEQPKPFLGWLMVVEDTERSRSPVRDRSPHFPVSAEFQGASYLKRYDLLCQKLVKEQLYSCAALIASPREAATTGNYSELSNLTSLKSFVTALAGHIAMAAIE